MGRCPPRTLRGGRVVLWSTTSVPRRRHPVFTSRVPQHRTPRTSLHRTDCSKENTKDPAAGSSLQESAAGPFPPDSRSISTIDQFYSVATCHPLSVFITASATLLGAS